MGSAKAKMRYRVGQLRDSKGARGGARPPEVTMGRGPEWVRAISSCPDSDRALSWRFMSSSAPASKGLPSRPGPPCSTATNMQGNALCC